MNNLLLKKQKSCGFCNTANHTITSCPTKCGIVSIIDGDVLVEYLQNICAFKVIDSELCANVFYEPLNCYKVQHLKCHQLLSKTIPCINQRHDNENLLVKVTCYEKHGKYIVGFIRVIFPLPLIISFIHSQKNSKTTKLFSALEMEYIGEKFFSYKKEDKSQFSEEMIQKSFMTFFSNINK